MESAKRITKNTSRYMHCYMTDDEIKVSFRQAKDKPMQVRILAELNLKTVEDMARILESLGFDLTGIVEKVGYRSRSAMWTQEETETMLLMREVQMMPFDKIAVAIHRSEYAVKKRYTTLRGKRREKHGNSYD